MESFQSIVDRNPFGLKPPPPPPAPSAPPEKVEPKTEFYLSGITTVGYPKHPKAYLVNKDANKKGNEKYYNLILNERVGDLTLTDIDVKNRKVKIQYRGEDQWLSMKDNGVPASAVPQPPPQIPGMAGTLQHPGQPGPVPLPMGGQQPNVAPAPTQPNLYPSSSINRRIPRAGNMGGSMPMPNMGSYGASQPAQNPQGQEQQMDPVEQALRMRIDDAAKRKMGIEMPPLPPL